MRSPGPSHLQHSLGPGGAHVGHHGLEAGTVDHRIDGLVAGRQALALAVLGFDYNLDVDVGDTGRVTGLRSVALDPHGDLVRGRHLVRMAGR